MAAAATIANAKVFDGTQVRDWTSVWFAGGLITQCSAVPAAREGGEVIDAGGGTVLPGLVASAKEQAGSRPDVADVRSSGVGATAPAGHPSMMYAPFPALTAAGQAGQFVAERIAEGPDYLKIISGIGGLWPLLGSETIKALVTAAHARGLVDARPRELDGRCRAGRVRRCRCGGPRPRERRAGQGHERMAEAAIVVGPALTTIENSLGGAGGAAVAGDPRLAEVPGDAWARRLTSDASGWNGRHMPPYSRAGDSRAARGPGPGVR